MAYVYVLISKKDSNRYIGSTEDLSKRLRRHNQGRVKSTRNRRPLKLYAYQKCSNMNEARWIELQYKKSRGLLKKAIKKGILRLSGHGATG